MPLSASLAPLSISIPALSRSLALRLCADLPLCLPVSLSLSFCLSDSADDDGDRGSIGEESGERRGRPLSGDTKVMQVYAEALVEDLRATIAKSGGDFVELKSRQHQKEGYKKVRVRALLRGRACACDVQQTQETTFVQYNARNGLLRHTAGT